MKITKIEIYLLRPALAERPFPVKPVVCCVYTQEGLCGFGEAGISTGYGEHAVAGMLRDLAPLMLGTDPLGAEPLWKKLQRVCHGHISGGGAVFYAALSALDIALLDLKGKVLGVPACVLLGGKYRDSFPCYASQVQDGWRNCGNPPVTPQEFADLAVKLKERGFMGAKFNFLARDEQGQPLSAEITANPAAAGQLNRLVSRRLEAVRNAVGPDFEIGCENLCALCPETALALDALFFENRVLFSEECLYPWQIEGYAWLARRAKTPLAGGEKLWTRWAFAPFFQNRAIALAQPDVTGCGGLTEAKKIANLAELHGISVQAHVCGGPIATAAALQLEAAISNFAVHEYLSINEEPEVQSYGSTVLVAQQGRIQLPEGNGIGMELSEQAVRQAEKQTITL